MSLWLWLLPAMVSSAISPEFQEEQDDSCTTYVHDSLLHLDCSDRGLTDLPEGLNTDVRNNFTYILLLKIIYFIIQNIVKFYNTKDFTTRDKFEMHNKTTLSVSSDLLQKTFSSAGYIKLNVTLWPNWLPYLRVLVARDLK